MPHITIRVTEEEKREYHDLAELHGRTLTDLVKTFLTRLSKRSPRKR